MREVFFFFFFLCMLSAIHEIKRSQKNMNKSFGINNDAWNKNGTTFVHTQFTLSFLSRAPIPPQIFYGLRISLWIFRINSASESKEGLSEWGNNNFGFRTGCFFFFFLYLPLTRKEVNVARLRDANTSFRQRSILIVTKCFTCTLISHEMHHL